MIKSLGAYCFKLMDDNKAKILDIAMNLNRIGNWAADNFVLKQKRISMFLDQTTDYLNSFKKSNLPNNFKKTINLFLVEYKKLEKEGRKNPKDKLEWAEKMMTWGNILTHRSKLLNS